MKKNVLITGGAGFIGSNLALKLVALGHSVTVLDNLSPQIHGANPEQSPLYCAIKDKVRFIKGTVESRIGWQPWWGSIRWFIWPPRLELVDPCTRSNDTVM